MFQVSVQEVGVWGGAERLQKQSKIKHKRELSVRKNNR